MTMDQSVDMTQDTDIRWPLTKPDPLAHILATPF